MNPILILILAIILIGFLVDLALDLLNVAHINPFLPERLLNRYNTENYAKSQSYLRQTVKFGMISSGFSFLVVILMFILGGFTWLNEWVTSITNNAILSALLFFGFLLMGSGILTFPFEIWSTFVIEERFGFNKTTVKTFLLDKLKALLLIVCIGVPLAAFIIYINTITGASFWLWTWLVMTLFSLFITLFYSTLIVPLFNRQRALENGSLRAAIEVLAKQAGFPMNKIFVIDGSKRSSKSNAYFSGFGKRRRIVLYDTLIHDLDEAEVVAVLAHEIGHYRRKHIGAGMILSVIQTGFMLFLFSLIVGNPLFSEAVNIPVPSFHIGLLVFGVLFSPVSSILGILFNKISRVFEYQADTFAAHLGLQKELSSALIRLSEKNLSNLTPHPAYVFVHYSHPTVLQRLTALDLHTPKS